MKNYYIKNDHRPSPYREQLEFDYTFYVNQYRSTIFNQNLFDALHFHIVDGNSDCIRAITPTNNNQHKPNISNRLQIP